MQSPKLSLPKLKANLNNFAANMNDKRLIQTNLQMNGNAELKRLEAELKKIVEGMLRKGTAGLANDYDNGRTVLVERASGRQILGFDGMVVSQPGMLSFKSSSFPLSDARTEILGNESSIPYLYLDINGHVTVGVGHLVTDENAAVQLHNSDLPFTDRASGKLATNADVKKAYNIIKQTTAAKHHTHYKGLTSLSVDNSNIMTLLDKDINERMRQLLSNNKFPFFNTYPRSVQIILADLAFQLGNTGTNRLDEMKDALERRDWLEAATWSERAGFDMRNNKIWDLFINVTENEEPFFVNISGKRMLITSDGKLKKMSNTP